MELTMEKAMDPTVALKNEQLRQAVEQTKQAAAAPSEIVPEKVSITPEAARIIAQKEQSEQPKNSHFVATKKKEDLAQEEQVEDINNAYEGEGDHALFAELYTKWKKIPLPLFVLEVARTALQVLSVSLKAIYLVTSPFQKDNSPILQDLKNMITQVKVELAVIETLIAEKKGEVVVRPIVPDKDLKKEKDENPAQGGLYGSNK